MSEHGSAQRWSAFERERVSVDVSASDARDERSEAGPTTALRGVSFFFFVFVASKKCPGRNELRDCVQRGWGRPFSSLL